MIAIIFSNSTELIACMANLGQFEATNVVHNEARPIHIAICFDKSHLRHLDCTALPPHVTERTCLSIYPSGIEWHLASDSCLEFPARVPTAIGCAAKFPARRAFPHQR